MKHISIPVFTVILLLVLLLSACQLTPTEIPGLELTVQGAIDATRTAAPTATPLPTATNTPEPTFTPTPARIQYGPTGFPENVNPLTGLVVSDPAILNRRPVMVKVANFPRTGRPHSGLSFADIVFDYYTGEGSNRFVALFYGQDATKVGPVRSGRLIDRWLVGMYKAILGMEYADPAVYSKIVSQLGGLVISGDHCPAICSDGPLTVTSRFANTSELSKFYGSKSYATNTRQTLDGLLFDSDIPAGGVDGHEVVMHFGRNNEAQWKFDAATGKYLRWIDSVDVNNEFAAMIPLMDKLTNEQLAFSNVIIIFAEIDTLNNDDTIHEYKIVSAKGRALIFRDGLVYDGTWKGVWDAPFTFYDNEKNPIPIKPGNTWIHIAGMTSPVTEEPVGVWRVVNYTP